MERKTLSPGFVLVALFLLVPISFSSASLAAGKYVLSENIVHLKDDGKSYLLHRTMRSDWMNYDFHVDKDVTLDDMYYISPNEYQWDDTSNLQTNFLTFKQGSFVVMYPGQLEKEVTVDNNGVFTFESWDGKTRQGDVFGFWNRPGPFTSFVYSWILPKKFELLHYESNRKGNWVRRQNTITFFGENVNSLTFKIRYRLKEVDDDGDGVLDSRDKCPETPTGAAVNETGCEFDTDGDGVVDRKDQCPDTPTGATVNEIGCEIDTDGDGVVDSQDQCPETPAGVEVNETGCELDTDGDGVVDSQDQCAETPASVAVNETGCELDTDGDGVVNSKDQCLETPVGVAVNETGCELDTDGDSVLDSKDQCPESQVGAKVSESGCELDTDSDGIGDSKDQCPETPAGVAVNRTGCELDTDGDGVVNSKDQCPETPAGAVVNETGCELDTDGDEVADSQDQCAGTPAGVAVNETGCELDLDGDGVPNSKDQCLETPSGAPVDEQGCPTDTDGDGVTNGIDLCPDTKADVTVDATGCDVSMPITLKGVNFETGSNELTIDSMIILNKVVETLVKYPNMKLEVAGYTDSTGSVELNKDLSQRRAESVRRYLVSRGLSSDNLTAKGFGPDKPVADNTTSGGRKQNRRVELLRVKP